MLKTSTPPLLHRQAFSNRRRDPESKRDAVLQTAAQLFIEKSYARTSLNDVAERLNITKPALYHYFCSKEQILLECYRLGTAVIENRLHEIAAAPRAGIEKVRAFIRTYVAAITVNFGRCVMRVDENELSQAARAEVRSCKRKIDRRLRRLVEEGIEDGSIVPCNAKLASLAIGSALNGICVWYRADGSLSPEQIASQYAQILTEGLAANARTTARSSNRNRRSLDDC
jgi:AcrR family transcriptional regulator